MFKVKCVQISYKNCLIWTAIGCVRFREVHCREVSALKRPLHRGFIRRVRLSFHLFFHLSSIKKIPTKKDFGTEKVRWFDGKRPMEFITPFLRWALIVKEDKFQGLTEASIPSFFNLTIDRGFSNLPFHKSPVKFGYSYPFFKFYPSPDPLHHFLLSFLRVTHNMLMC